MKELAQTMDELTPIQEFYKDKTIFITGGSGFMGKVLIEKLLYSCSELKQIMVLVRPKKGKSPESRIEDMFKIPAFQRIKEEKPEVMKKLVPIQGDVTFDQLGLSGEQMERVCRETNIVFHCAATLRLEANLKDALDMNTTGTKRVLDIARNMNNLLAFIHLSTAFCYCDQEVLLEKVYDCPYDPNELIRIGKWMDVKALEKITPDLLNPHPNTYTYSKRLAEMLVQNEYPNMPVCIARPSIVSPAWEEPCQGWVDSLNGPIGIMVGGAKGVIRTMLCNGEHRSEVIPVDIAINGLIAIAYKIGTTKQGPKNIPVYNVTCSDSKKVTWREVLDQGKALNYKYPFEGGVWYPGGDMTTSKIVHSLKLFFYQLLPAYFIDFIMLCIGQKRFMVRVQKRIFDGLDVLQFFTTRQWDFRTERFFGLYRELSVRDQQIFNMDTDGIPDLEYLKRSILGGRQYCLKEPLTTLPKARRQLKVLYTIDLIFKILFYVLMIWAFLSVTGLKSHVNYFFSETSQGFLKQS